jgi:DNA-binding transcriptional LysR family regulator
MLDIDDMHDVNLAGVDLNLLTAFDALLVERNVTRAARRTGISQPAMSHALARLRVLLDDPILVRTAKGMVATARAEALEMPIRRALRDIEDAIRRGPVFDPKTAQRSFAIATGDYGQLVVLPPLLARLAKEAPGIDLRVHAMPDDVVRPLEDSTFDVAVVSIPRDLPGGIVRQKLFDEKFVVVLRTGHKALRRELDLETFVALPHALIAPSGRPTGLVDEVLEKKGLRRRIALTVPHFLVAPLVVASSDLVITLPERVARAFVAMASLQIRKPPFAMAGFTTYQVWHERRRHDPAHAWLRKTISECVSIER